MRPLPLLALALLLPSPAFANGQSTHVWISLEARTLLPAGPVADLLQRPDLTTPLVNGTMFPDWGYASGDRDHGEASHWEPFQQEYLRWIQSTFDAPYTDDDAAQHVAFLFGMASHGMADEHFDSLFMERSRCYDDGWQLDDVASLDTASDVLFMNQVGGIPAPEPWLPVDALSSVYALAMPNQPLDVDGMEWGNRLLHVAVATVNELSTNEERIETFTALYPWSTERFLDPATPGSPLTEAEAVKRYWLALWDRLQGTADFASPVAMMTPAPGSYGHAVTAAKPEGRVHLAFAHGVRAATLSEVTIATAEGEDVPVDVDHFYGDLSHAVLARPLVDWEPETDYVLTVGAGVTDIDGLTPATPWTATFSTKAPPPEPEADAPVDEDGDEPGGCGSQMGGPGAGATPLLVVFGALAPLVRRRRR
ncbi:MAG: Ig-like domain-containing protein [Deltaproteobacteria bacterium]|nr:Ig-like domain-containing protein [Deltaproteobacteria bacterium]